MQTTAQYWIHRLTLQPHPEGGYYKEVFKSQNEIVRPQTTVKKRACTSIYYLLENNNFSAFHRLASDELWYFHKGSPLLIHIIDEKGNYTATQLSDRGTGNLQTVILANSWFAAEIPSGKGFSLVSCAVAPGFEFSEFEMADKDWLTTQYPVHETLFERLCRG